MNELNSNNNNKTTSTTSLNLENANQTTNVQENLSSLRFESPAVKAMQEYNNRLSVFSNMCRQLGDFSLKLQSPIYQLSPSFEKLNITPLISGIYKTIEYDKLITNNISKTLNRIIDIIDFSSITESLTKTLNSLGEIFKQFDFGSLSQINGYDVEILNKFYWVIPFEYKYDNLSKLSKYKTRVEFEKYMMKYFNDNRTKRMFNKIRRQCKDKDKKALIKQVEHSFNIGDYAICITTLITLLDGLTLQLLDPKSDKQHLSYKVINDMLEYMNECPLTEYSYELYLKVDILNNFYLKLYEAEENFKTTNKRILSRHINSHGVKYLNKRIEVLRLLNVICYCQEIIEETELQEQFTRGKKDKKFLKITSDIN